MQTSCPHPRGSLAACIHVHSGDEQERGQEEYPAQMKAAYDIRQNVIGRCIETPSRGPHGRQGLTQTGGHTVTCYFAAADPAAAADAAAAGKALLRGSRHRPPAAARPALGTGPPLREPPASAGWIVAWFPCTGREQQSGRKSQQPAACDQSSKQSPHPAAARRLTCCHRPWGAA
jgi:hypothetical protein